MRTVRPITEKEFRRRGRNLKSKYVDRRWLYYGAVSEWFTVAQEDGTIPTEPRVLELGPGEIPMIWNATYMANQDDGFPLTVQWDAKKSPWPFPDNSFDVFVALQSFEHLEGYQRVAWKQVERVVCPGGWAILSIPYRWPLTPRKDHEHLDLATIHKWTHRWPQMSHVGQPSIGGSYLTCWLHLTGDA